MEQTLLQCEGFEGHEAAVKEVCARRRPTLHTQQTSLNALPSPSQGLKLWMLKVQRAGDRAFDRFEKETGETVFHVPSDLQQGAAAACVDESAVDAEVGTLESQLYQQTVLRRELQRKLAAAQARIAAAGGAGSTALVINGVRAEEEEAPLDAEDERIEAALRQGTPHEAILGGHYEAAASDVGEISEGEEGGGDGAPEEELGEGDVPLLPYRATSGLVRERTARNAEDEPPAKAPRWCDRSTPG